MTSEEYYRLVQPYQDAMTQILSRLEILNHYTDGGEDFKPVHSIKHRIKEKESLEGKLGRLSCAASADAARDRLMDIAGVRVICYFEKDIRRLASSLSRQSDLIVLVTKDYIANPKPNGYRSYHLIVGVPVYTLDNMEYYPVEIQFRTIAMDFWAAMEHRVCYKTLPEDEEKIRSVFKTYSEVLGQMEETFEGFHENEPGASGTAFSA